MSDTKLGDTLYLWFVQKCSQGVPISGPFLIAKALVLNEKVNPGDDKFKASSGWLKNFQSRHGIHQLAIQGETMSANKDSVGDFKSSLSQLIKTEGLVLPVEKPFCIGRLFQVRHKHLTRKNGYSQ